MPTSLTNTLRSFTDLLASIRSFNRNIHYYLLTTLMLGLSVDGVYAVLFNLYLLRLGYNEEVIGLINSAGLYTFAFGSFAAGLFGSRYGSRKMLIFGVVAVLLGGTLVPFSSYIPESLQQICIVAGYMTLMGGWASFFVNGSPFMMGSADEKRRNNVFSIQVAASALAAFGGSLLGGALPGIFGRITQTPLSSPDPYRLPMQLLVILMIPAWLLIRRTTEPRTDLAGDLKEKGKEIEENRPKPKRSRLPILLIIVIAFIRLMQVAGLGATSTFINVYLDTILEVPTVRIGALTAVSRLVGVPAALLMPTLAKRFGNIGLAITGTFVAALLILPIALIPHWLAAGFGFVGARIMSSIRYPAFQVYVMELFESRQQSMIAGVMGLAAGFSFATMAFFGGFIISNLGFTALFLIGASITLMGAISLYLFEAFGKELITS